MMNHVEYLNTVVIDGVEEALERGTRQYAGTQAWNAPHALDRSAPDDIRHMHECHISVRLRDAEDAADNEDILTALRKIESAIGYLVILHQRLLSEVG